ncbi:MAG: hypothetical protein Q9196_006308 [Gyalolechia fulgens]
MVPVLRTSMVMIIPVNVLGVTNREDDRVALIGSSVTTELLLEEIEDEGPELGETDALVMIAVVDELPDVVETGPAPLLRLNDEPSVLVNVPVALMVFVTVVVLSAAELVKGVNG